MRPESGPTDPASASPRHFATTRWTLVTAAGRQNTPESRRALSDLCRLYWYPVYLFVRRRGYSADNALDLTQVFFTRSAAAPTRCTRSASAGRSSPKTAGYCSAC